MKNLAQKMAAGHMGNANKIKQLPGRSSVFCDEITGIANHRSTFQEIKQLNSQSIPKQSKISKLDRETQMWAD